MLRVPTWLLSFVGLVFGLFHAALGVIWIRENDRPEIVTAALVAYILILVPTITVGSSRAMPKWMAWLNLVVCAAIPIAINSQLDPSHLGDYATWYVLGVGTILGGTALRGRRSIAWIGLGVLVLEIAIWGGVGSLASTGLPGVLSLLVTGHSVSLGVERAVKAARELNERAAETAAETAAVEAADEVRSRLTEQTLNRAIPALNLIAALGGQLNETQKREAQLLEAGLRDEIRGATLLNDQMRAAIKAARERGVEVLVLDEGGLDDLNDAERADILSRAAASCEKVCEGRLTIRSPKGEAWRITVAAIRPGTAAPDLWIKLS
jgi:hypothetical protein